MKKNIVILSLLLSLGTGFFAFGQAAVEQTTHSTDVIHSKIIEYLEFREVDLKDVLRQLSKQYGLNIVFSESVKGLITVQLQNITIEEALDSIITINGFVYTIKDNVIKVTTAKEAQAEGKTTKVFTLNNADANVLKDGLQKVLSVEGSIQIDPRTNSLIVTDVPRVISSIDGMMKGLDTITPQVLIEAKFIEASLGTSDQMGINWGTGNILTASGSKRPTTFPYKGSGSDTFLGNYTLPQGQTSDTSGSSSSSSSTGSTFPSAYSFPFTTSATDFTFGTLDFSQLSMALSFLKTKSDSKLISSPRIVTTDNKEATIQVGETRRIETSVTTDTVAHTSTPNYEKTDIGVILKVTPRVTPDGHILLNLHPQVSSVTGNDANNIPIIGTRNADTTVMIKDGQTIVIGGLIATSKTEANNGLPFLSDIPLLGKLLFQSTKVDPNTKTELLIFVTARILHDTESSPVGLESSIVTNPQRPMKLDLREREVNTR